MLRVDRALTSRALQAKMLLQVHDELVLEAPPSELDLVGPLLVEEMKKAADLAVPLEVELGQGDTWAAAH
jgi:DNA polymerase-1